MTNSFKKFTPVRKYVMLMNFFKNIISFVRFKKKKKNLKDINCKRREFDGVKSTRDHLIFPREQKNK